MPIHLRIFGCCICVQRVLMKICRVFLPCFVLYPFGSLQAQNENLYFTEKNDGEVVESININGTGPLFSTFAAGANDPTDIWIDVATGKIIYVTTQSNDDIYTADLSVTPNPTVFLTDPTGSDAIGGIAFDDEYIYWSNNATDEIFRRKRDLTGVNESVFDFNETRDIKGIQVVGCNLYIADPSADPDDIWIVNSDGSTPDGTVNATNVDVGGNDDIEFIEVVEIGTETYIYWVDKVGNQEVLRIRVAPTVGTRELLYSESADGLINADVRSVAVDVANGVIYVGELNDILIGDILGSAGPTTWAIFNSVQDDLDKAVLELNTPNHTAPAFTSAATTSTTNIRLTFSENVSVKDVSGSDFTIAGATITAAATGPSPNEVDLTVNTFPSDFTSNDLDIVLGAVCDAAGNKILQTLDQNVSDGIAPSPVAVSPANGGVGGINLTTLRINFDEIINQGAGNIDFTQVGTGTIETIPVSSVTGYGTTNLTIPVTVGPLMDGVMYQVTVPAGAFVDASAAMNPNAVITGSTDWEFTAEAGPEVVSVNPANGSTITPTTTLVITFDQDLAKGAGNIIINEDDGTLHHSVAVGSADVVLGGTGTEQVTISNVTAFSDATTYEVDIAAGVFQDVGMTMPSETVTGETDWKFTVDATGPTVQSITRDDPNPTNASAVDYTVTFSEDVLNVTSDDFTVATVSGTAAGSPGTVTPISASQFTVQVMSITGDGNLRLEANLPTTDITDLVGNAGTGNFNTGEEYTVDNTGPAQPAAPNMTDGTDSGSDNMDNITNDQTPDFDGNTENNASVELFSDNPGPMTSNGTTTADGSGNWIITSSTLAEGAHNVTVVTTDPLGNPSLESPALAVTIDVSTMAPGTPDLADGSDSGVDNMDDITNVQTPDIDGSGAEANSSVELFTDNPTPGTSVGTATADGLGAWTITTSTLAEGTHNLTANYTDVAGNGPSASSTVLTIQIDVSTAAPVAAPVLDPGSDSGTPGDNKTNVVTPLITGGGVEPNSSVELISDVDGSLGTTTADGTGAWSITASTMATGVHMLTFEYTDVAGNGPSAASPALTLEIDDVDPAAPPNLDLDGGSDSGISSTDDITSDQTPTITGTGAEANAIIELFSDNPASSLGTTAANGSGDWSITATT